MKLDTAECFSFLRGDFSLMASKEEVRLALDSKNYWNNQYKSFNPTIAGNVGVVLSGALPYVLYTSLPKDVFSGLDRFNLLLLLQIVPALVFCFYIFLTGLTRIPTSPFAAHDPARVWQLGAMPVKVSLMKAND